MDPKELRSLMEAYSEVYAPQEVNELYKGKHGQTEKEYQDSRSHGGKMISGDSKSSGAAWSHRSYKGVGKPAKPGERQANQGKMDRGTRADIEYRKANLKKEELDIFDVVLEFLYVEGFAETLEEAEWMMANVIDEEAIGIILGEALTGERYKKVMNKPGGTAYSRKVSADPAKRATRGGRGGESDFGAGDRGSGNKAARRAGTYQVDEAQHARENPEKYEREQEKKSAPVRGERTPMPPRGDKRREDFEKWYAKQMGR
jgi:hypothetical protein